MMTTLNIMNRVSLLGKIRSVFPPHWKEQFSEPLARIELREEQSFAFTEVAQWFSHDSECQFDGVLDRPAFDEILTEDAMYADIHYSDVDDWQTRTR